MKPVSDRIIVRGAREHNLRNVSLSLPRDAMIVFTGLSGSGKSSLAFDTIFAEGQRRYVESLSSYARQFLGQMDKPDVDFIEGLSPAVSIDQKSTSRNPRSTVGTITEIHDYLRLLWARIGRPHCPVCGEPVSRQTPQQIVDRLMALDDGTRFQVLAPVIQGRKGEYVDLFRQLVTDGYTRVRVDGQVHRLDDPPALDKKRKHNIEVVVDRIAVKESAKQRLTESVEAALGLAHGVVEIDFVDREQQARDRTRRFSEKMACPNQHDIDMDELEPRQFSFNGPWGACPQCSGLGTTLEVDADLVVPDRGVSLVDGAVAPWSTPQVANHFRHVFESLGRDHGFDPELAWQDLPEQARALVLHGDGDPVMISYRNRFGRVRSYSQNYEGALHYVRRRFDEAETDSARARWGAYLRESPCSACHGRRLKPSSLAVTVGGRSIAEVSDMSIGEASVFLDGLEMTPRELKISERVIKEVRARLRFLVDVGLDYLTLSRSAGSLSGGEAQRIRLATQIGSGLVGVLYVLDEPSIGLHQRDNRRLIETLLRLRDLGNTLIVVEHDEDTIRVADWVVDVGPGAGEHGGRVVVSGPVKELLESADSVTGAYLAGRRSIPLPEHRRPRSGREVVVRGARANNLRGIDVSFPLGQLVVVTGVSGSGKSTLVNQILYRSLAHRIQGARAVAGKHDTINGVSNVDKVIHVDQSPIGRTPRSNPATYTGVFDKIRGLFAQTPEAKVRGYQQGRFSFNIKGGRCENCMGDGTIKIEMNFLPDVYVPCEVCHGARYNRETLEVHYKGRTIAEVLDMPIEEACEFFEPISAIHRHLKTLVEVGLGYVRLGQPATTLSGGEAQRVKLASELQRRSTGNTMYVLDEPTTGLHFEDIRKLLGVLGRLVDQGNSVVVIEHNLDVIKTADWLIDMGPEGGSGGGTVVVEGTPEEVAADPGSYTGQFLKEALEGREVPVGEQPALVAAPEDAKSPGRAKGRAAKGSRKKKAVAADRKPGAAEARSRRAS
ncbi:excinuclease ABC subunit UvrA [Acidipropionibacterium virtanenii]|uniref:UvrABC system protein A n=1 Tax=Acidipropionibacterium virtanenii TaxID=2057246 RepID=A0A344UV72_9ACTN|nr:excinuclease ABC subunit UvrA [Acidipropionibacterium virtanenii]AXE39170.1 UvrABC system protein A [Acidipropionibacterium virtanenii]